MIVFFFFPILQWSMTQLFKSCEIKDVCFQLSFKTKNSSSTIHKHYNKL